MKNGLFAMFICALCLTLMMHNYSLSKNEEPPQVSAYFSPKGGIEKAVIEELRKAQKSIRISIYLFTSQRLAECLAEKAATCKITVIMDKKRAESVENSRHKFLSGKNVDVRLFEFSKTESKDQPEPAFHHKFAVIDDSTVITGSYNWSVYAETSNYEDIVIIRDRNLSLQYARRFDEILKECEK